LQPSVCLFVRYINKQRLKYKTHSCLLFSTGVKNGLSRSPSFAKTALSTYGSQAGAARPLG